MIFKGFKPHIAVIDDGIKYGEYKFLSPLLYNLSIKQKKFINYKKFGISHGTICATIICKYAKYFKLSSIKILDGKHFCGTCDDLILAFNWCIKNNVNIINLSLGSINSEDFSKINYICNEVVKHNIIIVASQNNNGRFTLPACLESTIGVRHSEAYNCGQYVLRWHPFDGIDILTSSKHHLEKSRNKEIILSGSNSFATPYITALISNIENYSGVISKNEALRYLSNNAVLVKGSYLNLFYNTFNKDKFNELVLKQTPYVKKKSNKPIILIEGDSDEFTLYIANSLKKHLLTFNYYPCIISYLIKGLMYNFIIVTEKILLSNYIDSLNFFKNPDIFIICKQNLIEVDLNIDLLIMFSGKEVIIKTENKMMSFDKGENFINIILRLIS